MQRPLDAYRSENGRTRWRWLSINLLSQVLRDHPIVSLLGTGESLLLSSKAKH
jgi:hypothetical protein